MRRRVRKNGRIRKKGRAITGVYHGIRCAIWPPLQVELWRQELSNILELGRV